MELTVEEAYEELKRIQKEILYKPWMKLAGIIGISVSFIFIYGGNFLDLSTSVLVGICICLLYTSATNMMKIVRRLCDELGKTVILVLHEINYAAFYSDYICAFKDGKIARFGTVEEVMTKENLSQIYQVDFEILTIAGKPLSIYY